MPRFTHEFWEEEERKKHVLKYSLAPILEEAGTLLYGARRLWYPWSLRRKKELATIYQEVISKAEDLRDKGLTWAGGALEEVGNASFTLHAAKYHRHHSNIHEEETPCPEAAKYMISMATKLLFAALPMLQKLEKEMREGSALSEGLCRVVEDLVEAPYYDSTIEISDEAMRVVVSHAIFMECEGLAYMQAHIEDAYVRENKHLKRKKDSDLSADELRNLASKIGMSFDVVKDVLETENSSWWDQWLKYRDKSREQVDVFLSIISVEEEIKEGIKSEWDIGNPSENWNIQQLLLEEDVSNSETVIKNFIYLLLFFRESESLVDLFIAPTS